MAELSPDGASQTMLHHVANTADRTGRLGEMTAGDVRAGIEPEMRQTRHVWWRHEPSPRAGPGPPDWERRERL